MNLANQVFMNSLDTSIIENHNVLKDIKNKILNFITHETSNQTAVHELKSLLVSKILTAINENKKINEVSKLFL